MANKTQLAKTPPTIPHQGPGHSNGSHGQVFHQQMKIEQSPVPNGEMLDGLSRHIDRVGERWMTVFENQVQHEQSMARENLRVNETLNTKQLNIQESQVSGDNRPSAGELRRAGARV